jgi:hypothetical protein
MKLWLIFLLFSLFGQFGKTLRMGIHVIEDGMIFLLVLVNFARILRLRDDMIEDERVINFR